MLSSSFTSEGPQEDEEIKCPKCLSFFSSLTKPYILPCNHNICLNCLNSLFDNNNPKCPICSFKFTPKDKNSFEVNFTFLNIIIKILETKIIFCTKCNKIFYWKDHFKFCEQKYFQNCDNILDEIKIDCEESAKILKLIKENGDLVNKYKIELYNVTKNIMKEIHKEFISSIRSNIKNKLFNTKLSLDFNKIKYDILNYIKLFIPYPEHFDIFEINQILQNNNNENNDNRNTLSNSYSDIKIKSKELTNKISAFSPSVKNIILSDKKYKTIKSDINNNNLNNKIILKRKMNNKINKFLNSKNYRNNMKEIISEEKETEEDYSLPNEINEQDDEGIKGTERVKIKKYNDNNISKFKKMCDNNNTIDNAKKEIKTNFIIINQQQQSHQKHKTKFDIKSILNEDIDDDNEKNKIIIGLKDIKIISLKKSLFSNLNKEKFLKKINLGNITTLKNKNIIKKNNINENTKNNNNKINNNTKKLKKINFDTPNLNLLRSTEFTKRDFRYNQPNQNLKIMTKNIKKNINNNSSLNIDFASTTSGFSNITNIEKEFCINHSSTKENLSSRDNNKKINNNIYNIPQKNSPFVNNNMIKNYNKIKDSTDKIKLYSDLIDYMYNIINKNVTQNFSLLNDIIFANYELLLNDISFKSIHVQKNFCFSFFPNTYNIILYDPFNKKCIIQNFSSILNNKMKYFNLSNSIIFDDNDLIFITGGEYSNDLFLILSLNKKNIIYNKSMPMKKSYHKSIFIKNKLYIIGGEDHTKKVSKECSYFDMNSKKWNSFPSLKKERKNSSLCYYNDTILYVFMGEDNKNALDTIEYIDINNIKKGWNLFKPIDYGYVWHSMKNCLIINIDKDKILICGGENNENILYKDCFLFKPSTKNVYKGIDLKIPAAFISEGCFYKDEIFGIDYKNKTKNFSTILHSYNTKNNNWNSVYINNIK